jgi:PEP-CTERM motif
MKSLSRTINLGFIAGLCCLICSATVQAVTVYTLEHYGTQLVRVDSSGNWSPFGSGSGPMAVDAEGNLYVANASAGSIMRFNPSGNGSIFVSGLTGLGFVSFDNHDNLYATVNGNIMKFDPNGNGLVLAPFAAGSYQSMAVDWNGNVYLGEESGTIWKYDSGGTGSVFATQQEAPRGMAVDGAGNLYVASAFHNQVVKFDANGNGSVFANSGFIDTWGIAIDGEDNLYVVSSNGGFTQDGWIEKFDSAGQGSVFASNFTGPTFIAVEPAAIPEPTTWTLLLLGVVGVLSVRRWFRPLGHNSVGCSRSSKVTSFELYKFEGQAMRKGLILVVAVLVVACTTGADANMTINWSASGSTALTHPGGTTCLTQGSYLKLGYLSVGMTEAVLVSNQNNIAFVADNLWGPVKPASVADGTSQDGTFAVSWTGSAFAMVGRHMYLLALNAPTIDAATEIGLFTNPNWTTPLGVNDPPMTLDLGDPGLQVIIGNFSAGTVSTPGELLGLDAAQLHAVPEPASFTLVAAALMVATLAALHQSKRMSVSGVITFHCPLDARISFQSR